MKNKKLTLKELRIKSFITTINSEFVRGGKVDNDDDDDSEIDTGGISKGDSAQCAVGTDNCYSGVCPTINNCPSANQLYDCQIQ